MKSILYVTLIEDPINNGILNSQVISVLKGVVKAGHRVTLFSAPSKYFFSRHSSEEIAQFKQKLNSSGIKFYCSPIPVLSNASIRFYLIPWLILFSLPAVLFVAVRGKVEVIHCRSYPASLIGMLVKMLTGKKFIFDMRGVYPEEGEFLFPNWHKGSLNFKTWKLVEKWMLLSADHIVVVSDHFKQHVLSEYPTHADAIKEKVSTIVCGVAPESIVNNEIPKTSPHEPIRLVYSGTLDGWTSPKLLAKTYRQILEHNKQHNFVLNIYTTSNQELIRSAFINEDIDSSKYFVQRLNADEVASKLRENDIGILVREKSIVNEVSFPVKLGEYLAAGLPVVINSALAGAGEFVVENKIGVELEKEQFSLHKILTNFDVSSQQSCVTARLLSNNADLYVPLYRHLP